jgi:hypothetical protein
VAESCSWTICGALRFGGDEPLARAQVKEPHPKSLQDHKKGRAGRPDLQGTAHGLPYGIIPVWPLLASEAAAWGAPLV